MAQQAYLWEGDLVTGFDFLDLWSHEEWGNGDAFFDVIVADTTRTAADFAVVSDAAIAVLFYGRELSDLAFLGDLAEFPLVRPRELADQAGLADALLSSSLVRFADLLDVATLADASDPTGFLRFRDVFDITMLPDSDFRSVECRREVSDASVTTTIQQASLWEGDLVTGFNFLDLWAYEEWGNGEAIFDVSFPDAKNATMLPDLAQPSMVRPRELVDSNGGLSDTSEFRLVRLADLFDTIILSDSFEAPWFVRWRDCLDSMVLSDSDLRSVEWMREFSEVSLLLDQAIREVLRQHEITDGIVLLDTLQPSGIVVYATNPVAAIYRPRLLITLTVGAQTKLYSSEDLEA